MRDRLLVRHFLWRFLEHDLISPNADRHVLLSVLGATLVALSTFLAVLIAAPYQFFPDMPPGMVSLRSLDERFFFASASMVVMALVAVAQWDALALDSRDTSALGVLPIPRAVIVRTKFMAVGVLVVGVAVALNLGPTLLRFVAVPPGLRVGLMGSLALTLAHGVTTLAAGAFGFLAVMGLREVMSAIGGQAWLRRISATVQAALIVALVTALLLLPGITGVARNLVAQGSLTSKAVPPLWFVGLHETLAGSVVDRIQRTSEERIFAGTSDFVQEPGESDAVFQMRRRVELGERRRIAAARDATNLYRSLWPRYHALAPIGIAALAIVSIVTTAACLWNCRRLPMPVVRRAHQVGAAGRAWERVAVRVIGGTSLRQAGFFFALQTLSRQVSHRVALAASFAVGLSLVLITAQGRVLAAGRDMGDVASIPVALLAGQWLLLGSAVSGFRHAVRIPAELGATTTFSLAWAGNRAPYISGVKRAGWFAVVLPTLAGLFLWHVVVLGVRLAALHLGVGLVVSTLLLETVFARYRRLPFVSCYTPTAELKSRGFVYLAALLIVSFGLAWIERSALTAPAGYLMLVASVLGLSGAMRAFDRASRWPAVPLDPDESVLSAQRLNLAS
jgi:hypothetical protein